VWHIPLLHGKVYTITLSAVVTIEEEDNPSGEWREFESGGV